ncbi:MAG TPA: hypothetical protein VIN11_06130, partial [Roseivirga sp.]
YCLIAGLVVVIFFASSSTKLPNYTVPSYPVLAVVLGVYLSQIDSAWLKNIWNKIGLICYSLLLTAFPLGVYFGLKADPSLSHLSHLSYYFLVLSAIGIYNWVTIIRGKSMTNVLKWNAAGWMVTILLFFYLIFPPVDAENPVRKLLPGMNTQETIISYQRLNPAFVFALEREIPRYIALEEVKAAMTHSATGYLISRTEFLDELETIPGLMYHSEARDLFENPTTLIMKWGE